LREKEREKRDREKREREKRERREREREERERREREERGREREKACINQCWCQKYNDRRNNYSWNLMLALNSCFRIAQHSQIHTCLQR
jgi:hypothetical protein